MIFGFAILLVALLLSAVAAYYSVAGLVAIFSAAAIPVIIMGGSLELGKIAATVWLHNNWRRAGWAFKVYLVPAVTFLMLLTSMGIFGYLSKAHSDQNLVSGDAMAQVAIYDEKIRTERDNIESNRRALKQLDEAVDQLVGRSRDERGIERSVQIRRNQQAERTRIARDIEASQKKIAQLNEERAPLSAAVRQVEAEVGPIKYIAALIYDDNPDQNTLERAVRFMIIMIVLVFDPLALTLILAANKQFIWARQGRGGFMHEKAEYPPDDGPLTQNQIDQIKSTAPQPAQSNQTKVEQSVSPQTHPYLFVGDFWKKPHGWQEVGHQVATASTSQIEEDDDEEGDEPPNVKAAMKQWKRLNPNRTLKEERRKLAKGEITELPWMHLVVPDSTSTLFGPELPKKAIRGDLFILVDQWPNQLYKFNGDAWIKVDKHLSDNYTYDNAYIDFLIAKVQNGEYDIDLMSDVERDQIAHRLTNKSTNEK